MNAYKNLPLAARIAIPVALVLVLGLILWMSVMKQPAPVAVLKTRDYDVFETAKQVLENNGYSPDEESNGKEFILLLPPGDTVTDASTVLAKSGVKDRTVMAKEITCPAAPGFTGTKAANERSDTCNLAKDIQGMLLAAGATAANVKVSLEENDSLVGPEKATNVLVQVFLPESMRSTWNAEQAARAISVAASTSIDRVNITDSKLQTLFDGSSSAAAGTSGSSSTTTSTTTLGCDDIQSATEVETKRAAVRSCYEATISEKLTRLLGGSDRYVLSVDPTIDSKSVTTTDVRRTQGPAESRNTQSGSGTSTEDVSTPPNETQRTVTNPAGDISSLRISVVLDKNTVPADKVIAVKSLLSAQIDPQRGDPAPVVKTAAFGPGDGKVADSQLEQIRKDAAAASDEQLPTVMPTTGAKAATPSWIYVLLGVFAIGTITALIVLWRRSAQMKAERERLEAAFANEQKLFENFAQQNPDQLAQELNALFGAPSASGRAS